MVLPVDYVPGDVRSHPGAHNLTNTEVNAIRVILDALGGGSGTVVSVAGVAPDADGDVDLTSSDIGAVDVAALAAAVSTSFVLVRYNTTTSSWPARPVTTRPVLWFGPDASKPTIGGTTASGTTAVNDLDFMWAW